MENCFVFKLNSAIDNVNLEVLGGTKVIAKSATKVNMWITSIKNQTIVVKSPNGDIIKTQMLTANTRANIGITDMSSYDYVVYFIPDKYSITELYGHTTAESGGASDATYEIKLSDFVWNLVNISSSVIFNEDDFKNEDIVVPSMNSNYFLQKTYDFNIDRYNGFFNCTELKRESGSNIIDGNIEKLLESFCKLGRTSGSFSLKNYAKNFIATFNNHKYDYSECTVTFSASGCSVTPGINFVDNCYCNGATYNKETGVWTYIPVE